MATVLVIENDPDDRPGRLGEWLAAAGPALAVLRPHAGEPLPADLAGYAGLVLLGGGQHAYPDPDGAPGAPWLPAVGSLLRQAVRHGVPTLAICLGAQLLATAHGGRVLGPALVARRDAAGADPLFAGVPFTPDVFQWHHDEVTELPVGAVLLAAGTRCPYQAFRVGSAAWGLQFHIEPDPAMVAGWIARNQELLAWLGRDPAQLQAATEAQQADLAEVWQPFAARFAALAQGELAGPRPDLPVLPVR